MRSGCLLLLALACVGCAAHRIRCTAPLRPINVPDTAGIPAPPAHAGTAPATP
jgi:hypothetical protein